MNAGFSSQLERALVFPAAMRIEEPEPDPRRPGNDVVTVVPLHTLTDRPGSGHELVEDPAAFSVILRVAADPRDGGNRESDPSDPGIEAGAELVSARAHPIDEIVGTCLCRFEPPRVASRVIQLRQEQHHAAHPVVELRLDRIRLPRVSGPANALL